MVACLCEKRTLAEDRHANCPSVQMRYLSSADSHKGKRAAMRTVLTQKVLLAPGKGRLSYDVMAKLALAAAEEHVRSSRPMGSNGIVTLYAKVIRIQCATCAQHDWL